MQNTLIRKGLVVGIIFLLFIVSFPLSIGEKYENILIKNSQSSLEVIINVTGNDRIFHITTYISNTGDENVTIILIYLPGGGFEIYNQNDKLVYNSPKLMWAVTWELTLAAYQKEEIFNDTWIGIDNNWNNLPSGNYSIKGVVFTGIYIYSEPMNIYLGKLDNTPPDAPTIKGKYHIDKPGEPYNYKFKATDPDGDDVRYYINWDDGYCEWTDYYPSGKEIIVNHTYADMGTACISARANDTHGALGDWGYLQWSKVDKNEIKPLDDYREIYTYINGWCWSIEEKRRSIFIHHDVELWGYANLNIKGIRFPFNFFDEYTGYVKVPCLLGKIIYDRSPLIVIGIAFGNIEWSEYK